MVAATMKKTKIKKYELLEERLADLEIKYEAQAEMLNDLLEYLIRVDANFTIEPGSFESWCTRLNKLRNIDEKRKRCAAAQQMLEEGYVVAVDERSLDAARLKKWLHNPTIINGNGSLPVLPVEDDIPF